MSKTQKPLTSCEAAKNFKKTIDKSLPLLGHLNDAGKENVLKYWRAVSSTVKLALNGSGDVISPPPGRARSTPTDETRDISITTLRVPLRHSEDETQRRLRVLGFQDYRVTDDYVETTYKSHAYNRHSKVTIEDASQLRPIPADLVLQICQLGDYSTGAEAGCLSNEMETGERLSFQINEGSVEGKRIRVGLKTRRLIGSGADICDSVINSHEVTGCYSKTGIGDAYSHAVEFDVNSSRCTVESRANVFSIDENEQGVGGDSVCYGSKNNEAVRNSFSELSARTMHPPNNETELAPSVLVNSSPFDIQPHDGKAPPSSDIETIISALEEELKKTGPSSGIHSISITSGEDGCAMMDIHTMPSEDANRDQPRVVPVSMVENVANAEWTLPPHDSTSSSTIQVLDTTTHVVSDAAAVVNDGVSGVVPHNNDNAPSSSTSITTVPVSGGEFGDGDVGEATMIHSPIDAQYDVVEYEVEADNDKAQRGTAGRKRKKDKDGQGVDQDAASDSKDALDRTCPMCHRVLTYPSSMAAHMRTHTGDRPYCCSKCDRRFTTKANRDRHEATHEGLKPFKCLECEKCFTEKRSLVIHMRSHTGERPYVCTVCHRGFAQKCTLVVHMDRHTNRKSHLCDICDKAFRQKSQLDVHLKRHKREANFPCSECTVRCYTKGDLDRHMIRHTGERPFACSVCTKTFTRKQYLLDHQNMHYGRKPYKCSVCSLTFHDMGSCQRHIKKHQNDEDDSSKGKSTANRVAAAVLTAGDYNSIVQDSQAGKVLTLEDGTEALVTAVDTEADGVTVYHVTCVHNGSSLGKDDDAPPSVVRVQEELMDSTAAAGVRDVPVPVVSLS